MNPPSSDKSPRKKAPRAESVSVLCFRKAPADLENISISRSYGSAPNCILLSLFQIPPSTSHISHRLIKTWLTKFTPPTNPIRDLQKTGQVHLPKIGRWPKANLEPQTTKRSCTMIEGCSRLPYVSKRRAQSIIQKAVGTSWKSTLFPHNLSTGDPQATSLKVMVST